MKFSIALSVGASIMDVPNIGHKVTQQSTAFLIAGPRSIAPWGDRAWRVSFSAQLVEGGSEAFWLSTPTQPPVRVVSSPYIGIEAPTDSDVLNATLMMLAMHLGDEKVQNWLETHHNIVGNSGARELAPYWEIAASEKKRLADLLSPFVRLGITTLDEFSIANASLAAELGKLGFDVVEFQASQASTSHG